MNKVAYLLLLPLVAASSGSSSGGTAQSSAEPGSSFAATRAFSLRPVRWSVVRGSSPRSVVSGRTVPITLQAEIAKGWHIYSLTQKPGGPIPLKLELIGATDVSVRGVIRAPKPERVFDRNFGIETEL